MTHPHYQIFNFHKFPIDCRCQSQSQMQRHAIANAIDGSQLLCLLFVGILDRSHQWQKEIPFLVWMRGGDGHNVGASEWRKFSIKTFAVFQFSHFQNKSTKLFYTETTGEGSEGEGSGIAFGFGL